VGAGGVGAGGVGAGGAAAFGAASALGGAAASAVTTWPQYGHFPRFPAKLSGAVIRRLHDSHWNWMDMSCSPSEND